MASGSGGYSAGCLQGGKGSVTPDPAPGGLPGGPGVSLVDATKNIRLPQSSGGPEENRGVLSVHPSAAGEVAATAMVELKNLPQDRNAGHTPLPPAKLEAGSSLSSAAELNKAPGGPQVAPGEVMAEAAHPEPAPARLKNSSTPRQISVKPGDSLSQIVMQWYPKNFDLGFEAIILAIIHPGQILFLPEINFEKRISCATIYTLPPMDGSGHLKLSGNQCPILASERFVTSLSIASVPGEPLVIDIIGGYENMKDLEKVLKQLGFPKGFDYAGKK